ncbi:Vacuolar protein sorting-associated protein 62 [Aspergillus melleus]|uniref:Vacuolar protein sorting-associated protein 62 n=1 Tax=Aspergillus melleus TaxID=138277 RepID=A0ACC3BCD2_9EURO|nr:Vacuolar protein sorting-associated protein 62 [Aspergillus melleus]
MPCLSHAPPPPTLLPASPLAPSGSCPGVLPIGKSVVPGSAVAIAKAASTLCTAAAQSGEVSLTVPCQPLSSAADLTVLPNSYQQMVRKTTAAIAFLSSLITYVSVNSLIRAINPAAFIWYDEDNDESRWIASSRSWFDRKACRWLGACGTAHFRLVRPYFGQRRPAPEAPISGDPAGSASWRAFWLNGANQSDHSWDETERPRREIPNYVSQYAPLVHLFSGEQFWPCDIAEHLYHTTPMLNYTPVQSRWDHPTLQDLDQLNQWQEGHYVFLTSDDNVEDRPPWIEGEKNIPSSPEDDLEQSWADWDGRVDGEIPGDSPAERAKWYDTNALPTIEEDIAPEDMGYLSAEDPLADEGVRDDLRKRYGGEPVRMQVTGGRSEAPAVLLVMDKGNGIVDAFWFYFYSFNLGNVVLNVRFGNHVGDWEHCLVRFHHGKPKALFFSAHSAGEAYSYEAVEKIGDRPVIYSAAGTHAMYATPGVHSYILPWGLLHDQTDRGPLWDPLLNSHAYTYDYDSDTLRASTTSPDAPTEWFYFNGHWGDKFYPLGDRRQYRFAGQYHYVNGPLGPRFKHLNRRKVCQGPDGDTCVIKNYIGETKRAKRWGSFGSGTESLV